MTTWTVTRERAAEIAAEFAARPRNQAASDDACAVAAQPGYRLYSAPSPCAAIVSARALAAGGATRSKPGATRVHGPRHLASLVKGEVARPKGDEWTREYLRSVAKDQLASSETIATRATWCEYYLTYHAIAVACGHLSTETPPPLEVSMIVGCGTALVVADRPHVRRWPGIGAITLEYTDGSALAYLGQPYPRTYIESPHLVSIADLDKLQNEDLRSWMIGRYAGPDTTADEGWLRYLTDSGAQVLDERRDDVTSTYEALMRTGRGDARLVVTCPTRRIFALGVPPQIETCEGAQAWIHGGLRISART